MAKRFLEVRKKNGRVKSWGRDTVYIVENEKYQFPFVKREVTKKTNKRKENGSISYSQVFADILVTCDFFFASHSMKYRKER